MKQDCIWQSHLMQLDISLLSRLLPAQSPTLSGSSLLHMAVTLNAVRY